MTFLAKVVFVSGAVLACAASGAEIGLQGDPALLALVDREYESLADFSERLSELESVLSERNDARAVFAAMYVVLTDNATILIDAGHFDDGQWVAAFMVAFGNLYRQAFLDYESGNLDKVPATWRVTFDAAIENNSSVFQHALMGIHSHINRDMAYALAAVTPVNERAGRFADFVRTNDFIVASIDPVENAVAQFDSALGMLDAQLGGIDERLLERTLTQWRFRAWRLAATIDLTGNTQSGQLFSAYLDHIAEKRAIRIRDARPLYELGNNSPKASLAVVRRWCW